MRLTVLVLAATLLIAAPAHAAAKTKLLFDADHGKLYDADTHHIGRFAFTCGKKRCTGTAVTADGRLAFAGTASSSSWPVRGTSGAYRGAHGRLSMVDITPAEWLVTVTLVARAPLHVARVPVFPANRSFVASVSGACATASDAISALPPFPYPDFDPLHPDPALLPQIGAFYTGPGDPRPALRTLASTLQALGSPPANRGWWSRLRQIMAAGLANHDKQDAAALAGDASAFARTARTALDLYWETTIASIMFGAPRCGF